MTDYSSQPTLPGEVDDKMRARPVPALRVVEAEEPRPAAAPTDVLGMAKRRLAAIEAELAAYKSKQSEAAMLRRMIEAAEVES